MKAPSPTLMLYGGGALAVLFIVNKLMSAAPEAAKAVVTAADNALTGNNVVTERAHNLDGEQTTAYQDKGLVGTVGAATNEATGGLLASAGQALGGWWASVTGADQNDKIAAMLKGSQPTQQTASQARYTSPPLTSTTDTRSAPNLTLASVLNGASFKDMANADQVNTFSQADGYGGGLSLR